MDRNVTETMPVLQTGVKACRQRFSRKSWLQSGRSCIAVDHGLSGLLKCNAKFAQRAWTSARSSFRSASLTKPSAADSSPHVSTAWGTIVSTSTHKSGTNGSGPDMCVVVLASMAVAFAPARTGAGRRPAPARSRHRRLSPSVTRGQQPGQGHEDNSGASSPRRAFC